MELMKKHEWMWEEKLYSSEKVSRGKATFALPLHLWGMASDGHKI